MGGATGKKETTGSLHSQEIPLSDHAASRLVKIIELSSVRIYICLTGILYTLKRILHEMESNFDVDSQGDINVTHLMRSLPLTLIGCAEKSETL